jgi:Protein of unknown function (DUF1826)
MPALPPHVVRADAPEGLFAIDAPHVNLVLLPRELPAPLTQWLEALLADEAVEDFELARETSPEGDACEFFDIYLPKGTAGLALFQAQVREVVALFAVFDAQALGLRLRLTDTPMCPFFHVDKVLCRLITTWAGPTTQWLAEADVDRAALTKAQPEEALRALEVGELGFFKGTLWPRGPAKACVHRSPASTQRRLVMTLDLL